MIRIAGQYILENTICYPQGSKDYRCYTCCESSAGAYTSVFSAADKILGMNLDYVVQEELQGIGHALSLCQFVFR